MLSESIRMTSQEAIESVSGSFPDKIQHETEFRGETSCTIAANDLRDIAKFCRDEFLFDYLIDITSIDNFGEDTVSDIWPTANWHERKIYDMMGIKFNGHPDLRRILMWDGYPFFPLRKDFPLEELPSEMPDVAFTMVTPLEGGPFVTVPRTATSKDREPRARPPEL